MAEPVTEIRAPTPSPEEAAAIVAALERFLAETAPAPEPAEPSSAWQRIALLEGVSGAAGFEPLDPATPRWGT